MKHKHIILLGEDVCTGCYLLRIQLLQDRQIKFGRHNKGGAYFLPTGDYLYVGSAMGSRGASSLGCRLLRHLTRCKDARPHTIREIVSDQLLNAGITAKVPQKKSCHWHIDYLLENLQAEVINILALRSRTNLEKRIAKVVDALPETTIPVRGLGASDHPGGTHLFQVQAGEDWWQGLPDQLLAAVNLDDGSAKI